MARADDPRMFVKRKGEIGLVREPRTFEDYLGAELPLPFDASIAIQQSTDLWSGQSLVLRT